MNRLFDFIEEHNWAKWAVGFVLIVAGLSLVSRALYTHHPRSTMEPASLSHLTPGP